MLFLQLGLFINKHGSTPLEQSADELESSDQLPSALPEKSELERSAATKSLLELAKILASVPSTSARSRAGVSAAHITEDKALNGSATSSGGAREAQSGNLQARVVAAAHIAVSKLSSSLKSFGGVVETSGEVMVGVADSIQCATVDMFSIMQETSYRAAGTDSTRAEDGQAEITFYMAKAHALTELLKTPICASGVSAIRKLGFVQQLQSQAYQMANDVKETVEDATGLKLQHVQSWFRFVVQGAPEMLAVVLEIIPELFQLVNYALKGDISIVLARVGLFVHQLVGGREAWLSRLKRAMEIIEVPENVQEPAIRAMTHIVKGTLAFGKRLQIIVLRNLPSPETIKLAMEIRKGFEAKDALLHGQLSKTGQVLGGLAKQVALTGLNLVRMALVTGVRAVASAGTTMLGKAGQDSFATMMSTVLDLLDYTPKHLAEDSSRIMQGLRAAIQSLQSLWCEINVSEADQGWFFGVQVSVAMVGVLFQFSKSKNLCKGINTSQDLEALKNLFGGKGAEIPVVGPVFEAFEGVVSSVIAVKAPEWAKRAQFIDQVRLVGSSIQALGDSITSVGEQIEVAWTELPVRAVQVVLYTLPRVAKQVLKEGSGLLQLLHPDLLRQVAQGCAEMFPDGVQVATDEIAKQVAGVAPGEGRFHVFYSCPLC